MSQFLLQHHNLQTLTKPSKLQFIPSTCFSHHPNLTFTFPQKPTKPSKLRLSLRPLLPSTARFPITVCKSKGSDSLDLDVLSQPEERGKPHRRVNGIFWIILCNIGIYLADHVFQVRAIKMLYLYHNWPTWYQFLTATFCHANWLVFVRMRGLESQTTSHLSSNLFFLFIFGKLVEEEEGNFALWLCYILTGVGANLISWLVLPRNAVSVGASGAVFGLFTISVLVKMSWDWRKILEVLILGQFVIEKVMEAAQASTALSGPFGRNSLMNVNHIAHLSGALVGVFLVWIISKIPSEPPSQEGSNFQSKAGRTRL